MKNKNIQLLAAKAAIKKIMDKYDCGGLVSLHNKTHTEFELFLPKWSLIKFIEGKNSTIVHMKHRGASNHEDTEATYHLIFDCGQVCENMILAIDHLKQRLAELKIDVINTPFKDR